ncbi:hypothetical protein NE852_03070 [Rhizobium sp. Pop5]|uniref:YciI family protein n=1 Tax=Rhizobium sp. Pop5 TaxID=1223565 RepID=UPI000283CBE2|nr:hypothetical protein [Rhizobium sp. Pop5]EJZ22403.1 hypothetical protein RCCGEPOP_04970 [Rhizobium sp. Pop5]UVD57208.1 hypothetical protein NE852_03070 [Rhizobium sp. Pop5]
MFFVTLKFAAGKAKAPVLMEGHSAWIKRGFDDGVFLLVGGLQPSAGGAVVAHNTSRADLEIRIQEDPFVAEGVVTADIQEVAPVRIDERLAFLRT